MSGKGRVGALAVVLVPLVTGCATPDPIIRTNTLICPPLPPDTQICEQFSPDPDAVLAERMHRAYMHHECHRKVMETWADLWSDCADD